MEIMRGPILFSLLCLVLNFRQCLGACGKLNPLPYIPKGKIFECLLDAGDPPVDPVVDVYVTKPETYNENFTLESPGVEKVIFQYSLYNKIPSAFQHLNPNLPLTVFINGFNYHGKIQTTWMYQVAHRAMGWVRHNNEAPKFNYILIHWYMPNYHADNFLAYDYYYKTLSKYKYAVSQAALKLDRIIDYCLMNSNVSVGESETERLRKYVGQSEMYGHSLGGQMIFHIAQVISQKRGVKFGKIVGLDAAKPCFSNYGINGEQGADIAHETQVYHTASGLLGVGETSGTTEIVANDGITQPGCGKTDIWCSHSRAWELLRYPDNNCQTVAYACASHSLFQAGACSMPRQPQERNSHYYRVVNLPELHFDEPLLVEQASSVPDETSRDNEMISSELNPHLDSVFKGVMQEQQQKQPEGESKKMYFFVKTAKLTDRDRTSHCLQHYQFRLAVLNSDTGNRCQLRQYINGEDVKKISLKLQSVFEEGWCLKQCNKFMENITQGVWSMVEGRFYTALMTFPGVAPHFISAVIENVNQDQWSKCIAREEIDDRFTFILEIAFMSNISPKIRRYLSKTLCGSWQAGNIVPEIVLTPCNRTRLLESGRYLDVFLSNADKRGHEPWYSSLFDKVIGGIRGWSPGRSLSRPSTAKRTSSTRKPFNNSTLKLVNGRTKPNRRKPSKKHPQQRKNHGY